jgi:hypothetical protein
MCNAAKQHHTAKNRDLMHTENFDSIQRKLRVRSKTGVVFLKE